MLRTMAAAEKRDYGQQTELLIEQAWREFSRKIDDVPEPEGSARSA